MHNKFQLELQILTGENRIIVLFDVCSVASVLSRYHLSQRRFQPWYPELNLLDLHLLFLEPILNKHQQKLLQEFHYLQRTLNRCQLGRNALQLLLEIIC